MASCVKEGRLYVGQEPHLGQIRGLDPWAVDNGITSGIAATEFGPNQVCTRAQVVTFLYKGYGSK